MRLVVSGVAVAALLLTGCTGSLLPSPTPATSCAGDQAASRYTLNLNATPPQQIGSARVSVDTIDRDAEGPRAAVKVLYQDVQVTHPDLRVGSPLDLGTRTVTVTHICVVENLPTPVAPGTSHGSVGLA